jgi:flagellar biosynthesis/type III secretory pathway protein FliH
MNKKPMLLKLAALTLGLGLVTGCATTEQLKQMQADITKAQESADAALAAAYDASAAAGKAQSTADAAAQAAKQCEERCNRIMEKSMAK